MWRASLFFVALGAAFAQLCSAEAATSGSDQLQAFTKSDYYKGLINKALASVPEAVFKRCPALASNGSTVTIMAPASFSDDGFPISGSWKQSFPVSGCGNDTILNFYFSARADKKINTIVGAPGSTRADLTLQRDTLFYANIGAGVIAKGCESFVLLNTKFEAFGFAKPPLADPGADDRFRPWWETWTMSGCGKIIDVPIDYQPDATGTQITQPGGAAAR